MSPEPAEIVFRAAWRQKDPALERDAVDFWTRLNLLPPDTSAEKRLSELCAIAYSGDSVVGVSTAAIRELAFLRSKLAMYRCAVSPEARTYDIATKITLFSRDVLEKWSRAHPEDKLMGLGAVVQSRLLVENQPEAIWPDTKFVFIGYTPAGYQMRVLWFAHATIPKDWPEPGSAPPS